MTNSSADGSLGGFAKRAVIIAGIAVLTVLFVYFLWMVGRGLLVAFASILFAVLLSGTAGLITRFTHVPKPWSLIGAVVLIAVIVFGGFSLGGARVVQQGPQLSQAVKKELNVIQKEIHKAGIDPSKLFSSNSRGSSSLAKNVLSYLGDFIAVPVGIVADLVVIVVAGIYFAARPRFYLDSLLKLFPADRRRRMNEVLSELDTVLKRWLAGRVLAMIVVGFIVMIGLAIMGVKLAFLLGFIAGILTFIPYLGAVISAIPAILVAILQGPLTALYVALLFLAAHILEGYILIPLIQERQVSMSPAYLILAQLLGGLAAGPMGVLLATPIAVSITIIIKMLYLQDVLGESVHFPGEQG